MVDNHYNTSMQGLKSDGKKLSIIDKSTDKGIIFTALIHSFKESTLVEFLEAASAPTTLARRETLQRLNLGRNDLLGALENLNETTGKTGVLLDNKE